MRLFVTVLMMAALPSTMPVKASEPCPLVEQIQSLPADGLLGATRMNKEPDLDRYGELYPEAIILFRRGRFLRVIAEQPFYWHWIFWADGRRIVADTSRLHGTQQFTLIDVASGRELQTFADDAQPVTEPSWVVALTDAEAQAPRPEKPPVRDCQFSHPSTARLRR